MKKCSKCLKEQSKDSFWHNGKLGFHTICKSCQKKRRRKTPDYYPILQCKMCGKDFRASYNLRKFCSKECSNSAIDQNTKRSHNSARKRCIENFYKNNLWLTKDYILGFNKEKGYKMACFGWVTIPEHRLIMMRKLNRELRTWEHVHHINGNKLDNREENLVLIGNQQHFTVTMAMKENNKLRERIIALEEEVRNLKAKQFYQEARDGQHQD